MVTWDQNNKKNKDPVCNWERLRVGAEKSKLRNGVGGIVFAITHYLWLYSDWIEWFLLYDNDLFAIHYCFISFNVF